ncbi:DUF349 domain-containing protein [Millionella massiliensis]|uniref:DUF349 domain-containing protein n=1 Tax=Millionella massiliensis TaxID=1871023 RepID=UPI0023A8D9CA|nr:DUF349 domain-containing protein [Millionella massiliensis]
MESQGSISAQAPETRDEQFEAAAAQPQEETVEVAPAAEEEAVETTQETTPSAETPETTGEEAETVAPVNPYAGKTQAELIDLLSKMLEERPIQNLRSDVEAVKIAFYKAGRADIEAQRAEFLAAGGDPEAFKPAENDNEVRFKALLTRYREKRDAFINQSEQEKERAYAAKLQIIEELKELVNGNETLGQTFNTFRELQQRWKDAGLVPQDKSKDLWETYHHHVENFYNYIKINKELRDLDLKKNYEAKTELAEEAEALMLDPSATNAFHKLQKLHDQWREIGPVAPEFKDALWERFKAASTQINKRHQEYFEGIKAEQKQNLALKTELCQKVEELAESAFTSHKEWNAASEQIIEIQKVWKTIGFAPKKDNTKIYERFRSACDKFFEAKRAFYQNMKSEIADNLQAKIDLCVQAEALQDSEDWKAATDALIALQKKWKEIGATSRKHSEQVWKRFRAASDKFFARKAEHFGNQDSQYAENLAQKQSLLDEMRQRLQDKADLTFDVIKEYQRRWAEIGFVPIKKKEAIQAEYRKVVDGLFDLLRGEERERHIRNFREKVSKIQEGGSRKLNQERERIYNKIRQIESDIQIWENNIGFFAHSKNAEALMKEVQNKIARAKEQINMMLEKIRLIDNPETATAAEPATKPAAEETQTPAENAPAAESSEAVAAEEQTTTQTTEQE